MALDGRLSVTTDRGARIEVCGEDHVLAAYLPDHGTAWSLYRRFGRRLAGAGPFFGATLGRAGIDMRFVLRGRTVAVWQARGRRRGRLRLRPLSLLVSLV